MLALAGCSATSSDTAGGPPSVSVAPTITPSSAVSSPPSSAPAPSTAPSSAGLCGGDTAAARTVAVYRAMLTDPHSPVQTFTSPKKLYVSATWIDGDWFGPGVPTGQLDPAVLRCLSDGVPGLPPVTTVPRPDDSSIPTVTTDGIRGFADGAVVVTFGDVRGSGSTVTSFVSVDAGIGQVSGGRCTVRMHGNNVVSVETHEQWVS